MQKLFITSFIQVFLVAINTIFLQKAFVPGIAVISFLISWIWVGNVKKANISTRFERLIYSAGAMWGGVSGYYFTTWVI